MNNKIYPIKILILIRYIYLHLNPTHCCINRISAQLFVLKIIIVRQVIQLINKDHIIMLTITKNLKQTKIHRYN